MELVTLIVTRAEEFLSHLAGVADGRAESVHDARVVSRKLRELLAIAPEGDGTRRADHVLRDASRHLGVVRDLEVMIEMLDERSRVLPSAALAIAAVRRQVAPQIATEQRALVKTLEDLDLAPLKDLGARGKKNALKVVSFAPVGLRESVRTRIGEHARALREAVEHAGGLYFPNRLHGVRVAIKKLRYTAEASAELAQWRPRHLAGDLRKIQNALGALRDAELLRERLRTFMDAAVPGHECVALAGALEAEIARGHDAYLARRDRLAIIADVCEKFAARADRWRSITWRSPAITLRRAG